MEQKILNKGNVAIIQLNTLLHPKEFEKYQARIDESIKEKGYAVIGQEAEVFYIDSSTKIEPKKKRMIDVDSCINHLRQCAEECPAELYDHYVFLVNEFEAEYNRQQLKEGAEWEG